MKIRIQLSYKQIIAASLWVMLYICYSFNAFATTAIDIDRFDFPNSGEKGVRISFFDIDNQRYDRIDYYDDQVIQDNHSLKKHSLELTCTNDSFTKEKIGLFFGPNQQVMYVTKDQASASLTTLITQSAIEQKSQEELLEFLMKALIPGWGIPILPLPKGTLKSTDKKGKIYLQQGTKLSEKDKLKIDFYDSTSNKYNTLADIKVEIDLNSEFIKNKKLQILKVLQIYLQTLGRSLPVDLMLPHYQDQILNLISPGRATYFTFDNKCAVNFLGDNLQLPNYIIRTQQKIIFPLDIGYVSGSDILPKLNKHNKQMKAKPDFIVSVYMKTGIESRTLSTLLSDLKEQSNEKGYLGELASDLTMLSFGYSKYSSKYGTDNGFDGIFKSPANDLDLFISESKCRNQSLSAKKIAEKELSEAAIKRKISTIRASDKRPIENQDRLALFKTLGIIEQFINSYPERIFKFAHRIKSDGNAECLVQLFSIEQWQSLNQADLSPKSPTDDRMGTLVASVNRLLTTPEEKITLFMQYMGDDCFEDNEKISSYLISKLKIKAGAEATANQEIHKSKTAKKLFEKEEEKTDSSLDSDTSDPGTVEDKS